MEKGCYSFRPRFPGDKGKLFRIFDNQRGERESDGPLALDRDSDLMDFLIITYLAPPPNFFDDMVYCSSLELVKGAGSYVVMCTRIQLA